MTSERLDDGCHLRMFGLDLRRDTEPFHGLATDGAHNGDDHSGIQRIAERHTQTHIGRDLEEMAALNLAGEDQRIDAIGNKIGDHLLQWLQILREQPLVKTEFMKTRAACDQRVRQHLVALSVMHERQICSPEIELLEAVQ